MKYISTFNYGSQFPKREIRKAFKVCFLVFFFVFCHAFGHATVRVVSNGPEVITEYYTIQSAIDDSVSGDTIYVQGSQTPYAGFDIQNKSLVILGPGWSPQTKEGYQAIIRLHDRYINLSGSETSGTVFDGLTIQNPSGFDNHIIVLTSGINDIKFLRVLLDNAQVRFPGSGSWSGYKFENSILLHSFFYAINPGAQSFSDFSFINNYLYGYARKFLNFTNANNILLDHNLFLSFNSSVINAFDGDCRNFILTNNIFVNQNAANNNSLSTFRSNITFNSGNNEPWTVNGNIDDGGNVANQNPQMVDQALANVGTFNPLGDHTIISGPAKNSATDGKDLGLLYDASGEYNWGLARNGILPRVLNMTPVSPSVSAGSNLTVTTEAKGHEASITIVAAEFFIDEDPGIGNGIPININAPGNTVLEGFICSIPINTSVGDHIIGIRVKDNQNRWSLFQTTSVAVSASLPLDFLAFTAKEKSGVTILEWKTTNEINTSHFDIQRSPNGKDFTDIGPVASVNTSGVHSYSFTDLTPATGVNYYRLKQVDLDGRYTYSGIASLRFNRTGIRIYPNPAVGIIKANVANNAKWLVSVYDNTGRVVVQQSKLATRGYLSIDVSTLQAGYYLLVLDDGKGRLTGRFLKTGQ